MQHAISNKLIPEKHKKEEKKRKTIQSKSYLMLCSLELFYRLKLSQMPSKQNEERNKNQHVNNV